MRIAVLSGKGGAGKTFISVNLAVAADHSTYVDCDVEEPNGRLFLKPEDVVTEEVEVKYPDFDENKCDGCRKCVDFCKFNALVYIKNKPMVFDDVCHSCGGCKIVCPKDAVNEIHKPIGVVETGYHGNTRTITGVLNFGEASGVPVIKKALERSMDEQETTIIDCPPGSACSVMESIEDADFCILVAEPTAFGFHNFCMVYELVTLLDKPCAVVINKMDAEYRPLEEFCENHQLPVMMRIPFTDKTAKLCAEGHIACEVDEDLKESFQGLLKQIGGAVR